MSISASQVKELRDRTGAGIMECKGALAASEGNVDSAVEFLRKKGLKRAETRSARMTEQGAIGTYVHSNGRIGVLVEVRCETDFVARNEEFEGLIRELAMQVAAMKPLAVRREEVDEEMVAKERGIFEEEVKAQGKPENVVAKIVEGKLDKFFSEVCLLEQSFIKDSGLTVDQVVKNVVSKLGENIQVKRFARFELGED